jgi:hypothetical protein
MQRVLAIWLDGFDMGLADRWGLESLTRLAAESARAELDPGRSHLTGLAGEHLATGLDPIAANRASGVHFDTTTYSCVQRGATHPPVLGGVPTVVLDACYFDLDGADANVQGLIDWGAHDPGGPATARPTDLGAEVEQRFGPTPARQWTYATPWPSPDACAQMGVDLTAAVELRAEIASWLLGERLPDWQLALIGVSEAHSATEGLFHGVDPSPRWRKSPSTQAAGHALRSVYEAIDRLVGTLTEQFADDVQVVFAMAGMGANTSDVPSMLLLGEIVARWSGETTPDLDFPLGPDGIPTLPPSISWGSAISRALAPPPRRASPLVRAAHRAPTPIRRLARLAQPSPRPDIGSEAPPPPPTPALSAPIDPESLDWMPLMRHQPRWPHMRAFAVPSFYDGRVRVNVRGREAHGLVEPDDYGSVLDEVEQVLRAGRDPLSGLPITASFERPFVDPMSAGPTDADLVVTWADGVLGCVHPDLGTIGPVPPRRTGGHTNPVGRCLVGGPGIDAADLGRRSSFDVVPTLLMLADSIAPWPVSGQPLPVGDTTRSARS